MSVNRITITGAFGNSSVALPTDFVIASDYDRDVNALESMVADAEARGNAAARLWVKERDALAADNKRFREALSTAKYRIEQGRVWNGMGWTLTGLHPLGQQKALDAIDEALSSGKDAP